MHLFVEICVQSSVHVNCEDRTNVGHWFTAVYDDVAVINKSLLQAQRVPPTRNGKR